MRRVILVSGVGAFFAVVALTAYLNSGALAPEELSRRCAQSHPAWESYQEDIKGQVGARPVAEWQGAPLRVQQTGLQVRVTFALAEPWASREAALPVLLRDPLGVVYECARSEREGAEHTYTFVLGETSASAMFPWIELHYPHTERRIPLDAQGTWARAS